MKANQPLRSSKNPILFIMCGLMGAFQIAANPPPEKMIMYDKELNALFENARFCNVEGELAIKKHAKKEINLMLVEKARINQLRTTLLSMDLEYAGSFDPNDNSVSLYALYLGFELLDAKKQSIGTLVFIEGNKIILNNKHIFIAPDNKLFNAVGRLFLTEEELSKK